MKKIFHHTFVYLQIDGCDKDNWQYDDYPKNFFTNGDDGDYCEYFGNLQQNASSICIKYVILK